MKRYIKQSLELAQDLCYSKDVQREIERAKSEEEVQHILLNARKQDRVPMGVKLRYGN